MAQYETKLSPADELKFRAWKKRYAPNDAGDNYDYRGAFKAGYTPDANGHWLDTFKKPSHPTFSDESIYAKDRPDLAGRWQGETYVPPVKRGPVGSPPVESQIDWQSAATDFKTRMLLKSFSANPEAGAEYLRSLGKNAWAIHDGMTYQVAIQKPDGAWGVLDPKRTELADLVELIPDVVQGIIGGVGAAGGAVAGAAAGAVGGPPGIVAGGIAGEALGSAAASGASEAGRQWIGTQLGINSETDVDQILGQAVVGGLAPGTGKLLGTGLKGTGKLVSKLLAKGDEVGSNLAKQILTHLAGLKSPDDLAYAMSNRALDTPGAVPPTGAVLGEFRDKLLKAQQHINVDPAGPVQKAKAIVKRYVKKVPVGPVFAALDQLEADVKKRFSGSAVKSGHNVIAELRQELADWAGIKGPQTTYQRMGALLDPDTAFDRKVAWQGMTDYTPGIDIDARNYVYSKAASAIRDALGKSLGTIRQGGKKASDIYNAFMKEASDKIDTVNKLLVKIKEEPGVSNTPESFIRQLHGLGKSEAKSFVEKFQNDFPALLQGTDFLDKSKAAMIAESLSRDKTAVTMTGRLAGTALGASTGAYVGGVPGAVIVGGLGTAAAIKPVQTGRMLGAINRPIAKAFERGAAMPVAPAQSTAGKALTTGATQATKQAIGQQQQVADAPLAASFDADQFWKAFNARPDAQFILNEVNNLPNVTPEERMAALAARAQEPPELRSARLKLQGMSPNAEFSPEELSALKSAGVGDDVLKTLSRPPRR